jgi:hypothetical protein
MGTSHGYQVKTDTDFQAKLSKIKKLVTRFNQYVLNNNN